MAFITFAMESSNIQMHYIVPITFAKSKYSMKFWLPIRVGNGKYIIKQ